MIQWSEKVGILGIIYLYFITGSDMLQLVIIQFSYFKKHIMPKASDLNDVYL